MIEILHFLREIYINKSTKFYKKIYLWLRIKLMMKRYLAVKKYNVEFLYHFINFVDMTNFYIHNDKFSTIVMRDDDNVISHLILNYKLNSRDDLTLHVYLQSNSINLVIDSMGIPNTNYRANEMISDKTEIGKEVNKTIHIIVSEYIHNYMNKIFTWRITNI